MEFLVSGSSVVVNDLALARNLLGMGTTDLAVLLSRAAPGFLGLYQGRPNENPPFGSVPVQTYPGTSEPDDRAFASLMAIADFNTDGVANDFVLISAPQNGNQQSAYTVTNGNADPTPNPLRFVEGSTFTLGNGVAVAAVAADSNADGAPDVVAFVSGVSEEYIVVGVNTDVDDGTFQSPPETSGNDQSGPVTHGTLLQTPGMPPFAVFTRPADDGTFRGDGIPVTPALQFLGPGFDNFFPSTVKSLDLPADATCLATGDLNGDGRTDVIVAYPTVTGVCQV